MRMNPYKKKKSSWEEVRVMDWWVHRPLSDFDPLISFANQKIQEENWQNALWEAMGREKFCWVTYTTEKGIIKEERIQHGDIDCHVSMQTGVDWAFPANKKEEIIKKIQDAIKEVKPDLPKIFGQEPSIEKTKELQDKVKQVLDSIVAKANLTDRQRSGKEDYSWIEKTRKGDIGFRLTGYESDYRSLPWSCTHFKEYQEILEMIRKAFNAAEERRAVISSRGFVYFDDEGEDASRTLSWMLNGFVEVIFDNERAILKKCRWCEKYFIHTTLHKKKYCSDACRYNDHNKGPISKG